MNADTMDEFMRSFERSYFGFTLEGKIYPAYINRERKVSSGTLPITYYSNIEGVARQNDLKWATDKEKLERGFPNLGNVKVPNTFAYLSVRPERQFKKGYVPENIIMNIPNLKEIQKTLPRFYIGSNNKRLIWGIYNREYWHPARAAELLKIGDELGFPLSANFALYINPSWEEPLINYKGQDVGVHKGDKFQLFDKFGLYKEQFQRETGVEAHHATR